jgi:Flp pilus assembly protein CpaB
MTPGLAGTVDPTLISRVRQALQPDWVHSVRVRRIAAGALVVLAAAAALRSEPGGAHSNAVVASRDLSPGVALSADDLRVESRPAATLPDGAQSEVDGVLGAAPAGPIRRGEVLTDVRLLGSRLTEAAAGPDARVVPLELAQSALLDVVRAGDIVDIVAAPQSTPDADINPRIVATNALVVLVSPDSGGIGAAGDRVVLVALPAAAATAVAAATLVHTITLTLH